MVHKLYAMKQQKEEETCVTFSVPTETDKSISYFHQQAVGVLPSSDRHLLGAYYHLKERATS